MPNQLDTTPGQQLNNLLAYGFESALPERLRLQAGPLTLELVEGQVRRIMLGEQEVVRRIYFAARDAAWRTAPNNIHITRQEQGPHDFAVDYSAESRLDDLQLDWQARLRGDAAGTLSFRIDVRVLKDCASNRIGLCLLHPAACAGLDCIITHTDGSVEQGRFPVLVSPHQPFTAIKAITHTVIPGVQAEVTFDGAVFEMEDQRNWTDASYKTYSGQLTPEHPLPITIKAGSRISQEVRIRLLAVNPPAARIPRKEITMVIDQGAARPFPKLGLGLPPDSKVALENVLPGLQMLGLAHLRMDFSAGEAISEAAARILRQSTIPLELALTIESYSDTAFASWLGDLLRNAPRIARWLVFGVAHEQLAQVCNVLRRQTPGIPIGAGSNDNLVDINRKHPETAMLDIITTAFNPQVHQLDNDNLVENLQSQPALVATLQAMADNKPLAISPISLKPRLISVPGGSKRPPNPDEAERTADPRQVSLLGASWLALALGNLATAGDVASITAYDAWGWRGVMEATDEPGFAAHWSKLAGTFYPAYHVLRWIGAHGGCEVLAVENDSPLHAGALALNVNGRLSLLVCNLTSEAQTIEVRAREERWQAALLHPGNVEASLTDPEYFSHVDILQLTTQRARVQVQLPPWGIAFIDAIEP